jgi:hypothetical protein
MGISKEKTKIPSFKGKESTPCKTHTDKRKQKS